ncbi:MAG: hypothetical protein AB2L20_11735 [Mangrovibacterium sp.]
MTEPKIVVNVPEGQGKVEFIHREGPAEAILNPKPPVKIGITGVIGAPYEFLQKRISEPDQINQKRCHVIYSRDKLEIQLVMSENDEYVRGVVIGKLEVHPTFRKFSINTEERWSPEELGQFLKMHRVFFPSQSENMDLVTKLKSFEANIESKLKQEKNQNGSETDNYSKVVNSNLPGAFKVKIPLFKGMPAEELEVEIYASINGRNVTLQLVSPGAVQALEDIRDEIIDKQISLIQDIAPDIAIIEQ